MTATISPLELHSTVFEAEIDGVGASVEWSESGHGRPIVFLHGATDSSIPHADVLHGVEGLGRTFGIQRIAATHAAQRDLLAAWFGSIGDLDDLTLVLQDQSAVDGIAWARDHADQLRALVLIDPIIRPYSRRELLTDTIGPDAHETVGRNAAWLTSSHVPKIIFSTHRDRSTSGSSTAEWAAANVRNLTLETLDLASGSRDDFGRSVRGWLGHISW